MDKTGGFYPPDGGSSPPGDTKQEAQSERFARLCFVKPGRISKKGAREAHKDTGVSLWSVPSGQRALSAFAE